MFRSAPRTILRSAQGSLAPARTIAGRRFVSTEPPHLRSRSWKNGALRWGIAIAGLYYYNTSSIFAEQPQNNLLNPNLDAAHDELSGNVSGDTLEALTSKKKSKAHTSALESAIEHTSTENASTTQSKSEPADLPVEASPAELEQEAQSEGAFNPETGEINWDCPCLGGMAHGPCGEDFKAAFSCFVYSTEEPKGMDCIEKFKGMQDCFQKYPEIYKGELEDDEELDAELAQEKEKLTQEIAERQAARKAEEAPGEKPTSSRLLEEPVAAPTKKKSKAKAQPKTPAPSSEPQPGLGEEHQALREDGPHETVANR